MERLSQILSTPVEELTRLLKCNENPVILDHFEIQNNIDIQDFLLRKELYELANEAGFKVKLIIADQYAELEGHFDGDYMKVPVAASIVKKLYSTLPVEILVTGEYRTPLYWAMTLDFATRTSLNQIRDVISCVHADSEKINSSHIYAVSMACCEPIFHAAQLVVLREHEAPLADLTNKYLDILRNDPVFPTTPKEVKFLDEVPEALTFAVLPQRETCGIVITDFDKKMMKVNAKVKKAFCAPGDVERNPVRDLVLLLTLENKKELLVKRSAENGGDIKFESAEQLNEAISSQSLHPADLKDTLKNLVFSELESLVEVFDNEKVEIAVKSKKKREGFEKKEFSMKELFEKNYSSLF